MKRKNRKDRAEVTLGTENMKCSKCLHVRQNEPFYREVRYLSSGGVAFYYTCWRCCRDEESTFLIDQRWPFAFQRFQDMYYWRLEWAPGVKTFLEYKDEKYELT